MLNRKFYLTTAALAGLLLTGGCAQITVTADTVVEGTSRIADATTNAVQGTSNFTTNTSREADARTHQARLSFLKSEMDMLRREAAAGDGERLKALGYMMQAENEAAFAQLMQSHYGQIFADANSPEQALQAVYAVAGTPPDMRRG